jgi:hypothetical protein
MSPSSYLHSALACVAYEDIYLTILDIDGPEWADTLRERMRNVSKDEVPTESTSLFSGIA